MFRNIYTTHLSEFLMRTDVCVVSELLVFSSLCSEIWRLCEVKARIIHAFLQDF